MPKIVSYGNPVLIRSFAELPVVDFVTRPLCGNSMSIADNGVGKSSTVIEPFMRLFDMKFKVEDKEKREGRLTIAGMLAERVSTGVYSYFVDFALDGDDLPKGGEFLFAGYLVDGSKVKEGVSRGGGCQEVGAGIRFLVPHGSEVYTDPALREKPIYEALGLRFYDKDADGSISLLSMEEVREQLLGIRGKVGADVYIRKIAAGDDGSWREELERRLGFDTRLWYSLQKSLAVREGGGEAIDKYEDEVVDNLIVQPLRSKVLAEADRKHIVDELAEHTLNRLRQGDTEKLLRFYGATEDMRAGIQERAEAYRATRKAKLELVERGRDAYSAARRIAREAEDRKRGIVARIAEKERLRDVAERQVESLRYWNAKDAFDKASSSLDGANALLAAAERDEAEAACDLALHRYSVAYKAYRKASAELEAARSAKAAYESGAESSRLREVGHALHRLLSDDLSRKEQTLEHTMSKKSKAATQKTERVAAKEAADKAERDALMALNTLSYRRDEKAKSLELLLADAQIEGVRRVDGSYDLGAIEKRSSSLADKKASAAASLKAAEDVLSGHEKNIDRLGNEIAQGNGDLAAQSKAAADAERELSVLDAEISRLGGDDERICTDLSDKVAAKAYLAALSERAATCQEAVDSGRRALAAAEQELSAFSTGAGGVDPAAIELLEREGIEAMPGATRLRELGAAEGEGAVASERRLIPGLEGSLIIPDQDVSHAVEAAEQAGPGAFRGCVPLVPSSLLDGGEGARLLSVMSCEPDSFFAGFEERLDALKGIAEDARLALARNEESMDEARADESAAYVFIQRHYSGDLESREAYARAAAAASARVASIRDSIADLEAERLEESQARDKARLDIAGAKREVEEAERLYLKSRSAVKEAAELRDMNSDLSAAKIDHDMKKSKLEEEQARLKEAEKALSVAIEAVPAAQMSVKIARNRLSKQVDPMPGEDSYIDGTIDALTSEMELLESAAGEKLKDLNRSISEWSAQSEDRKKTLDKKTSNYKASLAARSKLTSAPVPKEVRPRAVDDDEAESVEDELKEAVELCGREKDKRAARVELCEEKKARAEGSLRSVRKGFECKFPGEDIYGKENILDDCQQRFISIGKDLAALASERSEAAQAASDFEFCENLLRDFSNNEEGRGEDLDGDAVTEASRTLPKKGKEIDDRLRDEARALKSCCGKYLRQISDPSLVALADLDCRRDVAQSIYDQSAELLDQLSAADDFLKKISLERNICTNRASAARAALNRLNEGLGAVTDELLDVMQNACSLMRRFESASVYDGRKLLELPLAGKWSAESNELYRGQLGIWLSNTTADIAAGAAGEGSAAKEKIISRVSSEIVDMKALLREVAVLKGKQNAALLRFLSPRPEQRRVNKYITWGGKGGLRACSGGERRSVYFSAVCLIMASVFNNKTGFLFFDNPFASLTKGDFLAQWFKVARDSGIQLVMTSQPNPTKAAVEEMSNINVLGLQTSRDQTLTRVILKEEAVEEDMFISQYCKSAYQDRLF